MQPLHGHPEIISSRQSKGRSPGQDWGLQGKVLACSTRTVALNDSRSHVVPEHLMARKPNRAKAREL